MKEIIKENTEALRSLSGPLGLYLGQPTAQTLLAFYRSNFDIPVEELVEKVRVISDFENPFDWMGDLEKNLMDFSNALIPSDNPLGIFEGEPIEGNVYLAAVYFNGANLDTKITMNHEDGSKTVSEHIFAQGDKFGVAGLYTVETGFRFIGSLVSSASLEDVEDYTLLYPTGGA
mgnify:FL=1